MVDKEPLGGVVGQKYFGLCLYTDEAPLTACDVWSTRWEQLQNCSSCRLFKVFRWADWCPGGPISQSSLKGVNSGSAIKVSDYSGLIRAEQPETTQGAHADPCPPPKAPTMGRGAPEPDHHTMEEATRPHDIKLEVVIWSPDSPNLNQASVDVQDKSDPARPTPTT